VSAIRWDWIHLTGFFILGYLSRDPSTLNCILTNPLITLLEFSLKLISVALALAYAFTFNQIFEKYSEKGASKKILTSSLLLLFPLLLTFIFLSDPFRILLLGFIILFTLYSIPRFGLKKFPFIGSFINSLCFAFLFLAGCEEVRFFEYNSIFLMLLIAFQFVSQLLHELEHSKIDKKFAVRSTAIFLGREVAHRLCKSILLFSIFLATVLIFLENIWFALPISLPSILFALYFISQFEMLPYGKLRRNYRKLGIVVGCWFLVINSMRTIIKGCLA